MTKLGFACLLFCTLVAFSSYENGKIASEVQLHQERELNEDQDEDTFFLKDLEGELNSYSFGSSSDGNESEENAGGESCWLMGPRFLKRGGSRSSSRSYRSYYRSGYSSGGEGGGECSKACVVVILSLFGLCGFGCIIYCCYKIFEDVEKC